MEKQKIKCSDIPDKDVLLVLNKTQGRWTSHTCGYLAEFFKPFPIKLGLAKMRQLHKRGFTGGCGCGCRGDWEITDKGLEFIGEIRIHPYNGY